MSGGGGRETEYGIWSRVLRDGVNAGKSGCGARMDGVVGSLVLRRSVGKEGKGSGFIWEGRRCGECRLIVVVVVTIEK